MRKAWTRRSILSMQTPPEQNILVCRRSFQYFPLIIQQVGENSMVRHTFLVYLLKVPLQQPYQEPIRCLQRCWVFKTVSLISEALLCPKATALPTLNVDREHKRNIDVIAESIPQIFFVIYAFPETRTFFFFSSWVRFILSVTPALTAGSHPTMNWATFDQQFYSRWRGRCIIFRHKQNKTNKPFAQFVLFQ